DDVEREGRAILVTMHVGVPAERVEVHRVRLGEVEGACRGRFVRGPQGAAVAQGHPRDRARNGPLAQRRPFASRVEHDLAEEGPGRVDARTAHGSTPALPGFAAAGRTPKLARGSARSGKRRLGWQSLASGPNPEGLRERGAGVL